MTVQCELCPKYCRIPPGQAGDCRIRVNLDGKLQAVTYGFPSAVHVNPVEKKPLNHFLPGTTIFSVATVGCNLHCKNCQNWDISQRNPEDAEASPLPPDRIPEIAMSYGCRSVAYTYTDPTVFYEYTLDSSIKAREAGLKNVLVTAGYLNQGPLRELCRYTDAANVDLKAFSDRFYREVCGGSLKPVLDFMVTAKSMGVLVEVTNLVIPTLNDSDGMLKDLCAWVRNNLGRETPMHFSRFSPQYRMRHLPPTPAATLIRARDIARDTGLDFVYIGNVLVEGGADTVCPACSRLLVRRIGYRVTEKNLVDGRCPACRKEVYGVWHDAT